MNKLTYGRLCELAEKHGVTITENVRAFVREVEQTDAAQAATEPIAWESTTFGYRRYLTQAQYERIGERFRKWYKPYRCSACASHEASAPGLSEEARHLLEDASGVLQAFATTSQTANGTQREINEFLNRASATTVAEPDTDNVWPIVNVTVSESGEVTAAKLYAPGLPAGNHDVYPVRVPYMDEHTEAWMAVSKALKEVAPDYLDGSGNGIECAVKAIQRLAAQHHVKPPEQISGVGGKPTEQQAEPSDPTGLIVRLRIHAEDRANTAFARSSMREAAGVLEDRQAEASTYERSQQLGVFLRLAEVVQADSKKTRDRYPAQSERADQLAAFMKTACKWAARQSSVTDGYVIVPIKPTENMHAAAVRTIIHCHGNDDFPPRVWAAMIAAASQQEATK